MRIPNRLDYGNHCDSVMTYLWHNYTQHLSDIKQGNPLHHDEAERYACGFPIPSFQRQLVWDDDRKIKFIESLWLGLNPGTFTHHATEYLSNTNGTARRFSGWLIDGQQRLTAIQEYWEDHYPVFGLPYSELTDVEKRRFMMIKFAHTEPALWDENMIRELYNRMAFGGVAHESKDKA